MAKCVNCDGVYAVFNKPQGDCICPICEHVEHKALETVEINGTDETITICHDCGYEA